MQLERHVLEQGVRSVAKQARNAYDPIDALAAMGVKTEAAPMRARRRIFEPNSYG